MFFRMHILTQTILEMGDDILKYGNKNLAVTEMGNCARTVGQKVGAAVPFLWEGGAGSPSNTVSPGSKPTSIPSGILIHPTV